MQGLIWYPVLTIFAVTSISAVLPRPRYHEKYATSYVIHKHFSIIHNYSTCFILDDAGKRFVNRLNKRHLPADSEANITGIIYHLQITIQEDCKETEGLLWPGFGMNESCHTYSWGKGYPDLLTPCYTNGTPNGQFGPLNPANNETFTAISKLLAEADATFPDSFIHLGGDEVDLACWRSNPQVQALMNKLNYDDDYSRLLVHYFDRITEMVSVPEGKRRRRVMVWEEVFLNGYRTDNQTIIQVWNGESWKDRLKQVTQAGFEAVLSGCWYLNLISYEQDWNKYYLCDPADFGGTEEEIRRVIGGAAAMWSGFVDDTNVVSTSWPRGAAVAERLWATTFAGVDEFAPRLHKIECQMKRWGINAQPILVSQPCPP